MPYYKNYVDCNVILSEAKNLFVSDKEDSPYLTNVAAVDCCDLALRANIQFLVALATQSMLRFKSQHPRRSVAFERVETKGTVPAVFKNILKSLNAYPVENR